MSRGSLAVMVFVGIALGAASQLPAGLIVVDEGKPAASITVDLRGATGDGPAALKDAADWLAESIKRSTGAEVPVIDDPKDAPALVIGRADAEPELSKKAGIKPGDYDAYAIVARGNRVHVLGNSESAARHGVAHLLRHWGFRWFAPSPKWNIAPQRTTLKIDADVSESPALIDRRIWYAYGMSGDDLAPLMKNYTRWAVANRLSVRSLIQTGHSYGNIILRNPKEFAEHPEYYALLPDGTRDSERAVAARKFCVSNPGLMRLVAEDRFRLLQAEQKANPAAFMVSVDPSDGQGTCHCDDCRRLGTTSDRVLHLANATARTLRAAQPNAWVGLYAYSSHRLPPTIDVEPNVYVQVAMGFNRTEFTLPELIERWSAKVGAIGLREYYGVEAWDWGLPGRMRGGQVEYHRKWIPYYAERKLNAINAETNANWGAQTLGLYTASQLMWNPKADVDALTGEFFEMAFVDVAAPMEKFYAKLDAAPPLRAASLLPLFEELAAAEKQTQRAAVRERLVDLMAYLVYVAKFREFDLVRDRQPTRDDAYYAALQPLMQYAWRIRHRDMVHYYALARRLCNGLPIQDQRLDFYLANKDRDPVWKQGDALSDDDIRSLFHATMESLRADDDPTVTFSRILDRVKPEGEDAGGSLVHARSDAPAGNVAVAQFRKGLKGYVAAGEQLRLKFGIAPNGKRVEFTVFQSNGETLFQKEFRPQEPAGESASKPEEFVVDFPGPNTYRVEITGDFDLHVPPETPFVFEASVNRPAWISYSGPHYFYVPRGTRELIVDANPRLSLQIPGEKSRLDVDPAQRKAGAQYVVVPVPEGADGQVWHTTSTTRGQISLLNIPPFLSLHRSTTLTPREVSESDGLSTKK